LRNNNHEWFRLCYRCNYIVLFFLQKKKLTPEQIAEKEKKDAEAKVLRDKKAAEDLKKEKERLKLLKEKEKGIIQELLKSNERVYFSHSFVSEKSKLYLINSLNNKIIEGSLTSAENLYSDGFRIVDIDKTGQSAQLESFNFIIRFSKRVS